MQKRFFLSLSLFLFLAACNNSGNDADNTEDTADKMSHDSMHKMNTNTAVPDLPAVPDAAKVYFKNLKNGQAISSPFKVEMGNDNMRVDTIGPVIAGSGHYHIFIDAEDSLTTGLVVPTDSAHLHYGKAQKETELKLSPGKHKLTLQFADGLHRSYGGKLATTITVNVK